MAPRADAPMAVDDQSLVIFGGRDADGHALGDFIWVDLSSSEARTVTTAVKPRSNAAIAIHGRSDRSCARASLSPDFCNSPPALDPARIELRGVA
jgi:hypothetical protein